LRFDCVLRFSFDLFIDDMYSVISFNLMTLGRCSGCN